MPKLIDPRVHSNFTMVPDWLAPRTEVSPGAKLCYARLARWWGASKDEPDAATVTVDKLGADLGVSGRQAYAYLKELEGAGLIIGRRRGLGAPNAYRFCDHEWRDDTAPASDPDRKDASDQQRKDASDPELKDPSTTTGRILPTKKQVKKQDQETSKETGGAVTPPPHVVPIRPQHRRLTELGTVWLDAYGNPPTPAQERQLATFAALEPPTQAGLTERCIRYAALQGKPWAYFEATLKSCALHGTEPGDRKDRPAPPDPDFDPLRPYEDIVIDYTLPARRSAVG